MILKLALSCFLFLTPALSIAVSGGHGDGHEGIPTVVYYQIINFSLLVFGLWYLLKNKAKAYFTERKENFKQALKKAQSVKEKAEAEHKEMKTRLDKLESTAHTSIVNAESEAQSLQERILKEAEQLTSHIEQEAKRTIDSEVYRAKERLRNMLIEDAIDQARSSIKEKLDEKDQGRLQDEFVNQIRVIQ